MHGQGEADGRAVQVPGRHWMAGVSGTWCGWRSAQGFKASELSAWYEVSGYGGGEEAYSPPKPLLSRA